MKSKTRRGAPGGASWARGSAQRTPSRQIRVLQFAVRDPDYPRNSRIRDFLETMGGAEVEVVPAGGGGRLGRYWRMFLESTVRRRRPSYDLVILSEFSVEMFLFSWLIARRSGAVHVVDFFVGLYETEVEDGKRTLPGTFRARQLQIADAGAVRFADFCVTDTRIRAHRFEQQFGGHTRFFHLPVGAPVWAWARHEVPPRGQNSTPFQFLFYGNYLALHGLSALVAGIAWLRQNTTHPTRFSFVGDGPERAQVQRQLEKLEIRDQCTFVDAEPPHALADRIAACDVVLGVFGDSVKAQEVIANKVWQGLASGKVVVTRQSDALDEIVDLVPGRLIQTASLSARDIGAALDQAIRKHPGAAPVEVAQVLENYVISQFKFVFTEVLAASWPFAAPEGGRQ